MTLSRQCRTWRLGGHGELGAEGFCAFQFNSSQKSVDPEGTGEAQAAQAHADSCHHQHHHHPHRDMTMYDSRQPSFETLEAFA